LADPTTILGHGIEIIHSGGVDSGALIKGGTQFDSGLANSGTLFAGSQVVQSGGTANAWIVSGGTEIVGSGGEAVGVLIKHGGKQIVSGGSTFFVAVSSGGEQDVGPGGTAETLTIAGIGKVFGGGIVSGGGIFGGASAISGGTEIVGSGGTTSLFAVVPAARRSSIPPALPSARS
jgi:autotransporter passenger strand-loop-strand repeat protein